MKTAIKLGNKIIGDFQRPYIILEIARTYNNDISLAAKMIEAAAKSGADAIKIQSIRAKDLMVLNNKTKIYYKKLERLEKSLDEHKKLAVICRKNKIEFLSTPESIEMVDLLEDVGVAGYKIASLDVVYYKLLRYVARKGKPIFLSTGMADIREIKKAIEVIRKEGNEKIILLHCVSLYPPSISKLGFGAINMIREKLKILPGFSDHTSDITASVCAMAFGAKVIEKHFKIDAGIDSEWKDDYKIAIDLKQLKSLIEYRDVIFNMKFDKILSVEEIERKKIRRRKIITLCDIEKGQKIKEKFLNCKQNLSRAGIDCSEIDIIVGKIAAKNIKEGEILEYKYIK